jgi:predicted permease
LKSNNKPKSTWNIVKTITNNSNSNNNNNKSTMNINDKLLSNPLAIANAFNAYFSSAA